MEIHFEALQKFKTYNYHTIQQFPFLGIYLKRIKTLIQKDTHTLLLTAASLTIAKTGKPSKCPCVNG